MRTFAIALLALALPATAQAQFVPQTGYHGAAIERTRSTSSRPPDTGYRVPEIKAPPRPGPVTYYRELERARHDIDRRRDRGEISRKEAKHLRREAARIDWMARSYRRDGLTESERNELDLRTTELRNRTATGRSF